MMLLEPCRELLAGVLKPSVAVKQWMSLRLEPDGFIKSAHDQRIIIMAADPISNDPAVIQIQDSAQIYLMGFSTDIILEFCYIGQPLLVRGIRMEIPVQIILCDMCRVFAASCTALRLPFNSRPYPFFAADPEHPLVIDIGIVVLLQLIPDPPVTHVRMCFMDVPDLFRDLPVVFFVAADRILQPAVVCPTGKVQGFTEILYRGKVVFR